MNHVKKWPLKAITAFAVAILGFNGMFVFDYLERSLTYQEKNVNVLSLNYDFYFFCSGGIMLLAFFYGLVLLYQWRVERRPIPPPTPSELRPAKLPDRPAYQRPSPETTQPTRRRLLRTT